MARAAQTYRGNQKRARNPHPAWKALKADRLARGETRREADRRRWKEKQSGVQAG